MDVEFFSKEWKSLGSKIDLQDKISSITKIDSGFLDGSLPVETASVAKRLSWASSRKTTREEDIAYCLMGLFSVNMGMMYGEGSKAFLRLQEEIMRQSDDHTLFAWVDDDGARGNNFDDYHGLLADHPRVFAKSGSMFAYSDWEGRKPYGMTNRGLSIELNLAATTQGRDVFAATLQCPPYQGVDGFLVLYLKKLPGSADQYARVACSRLSSSDQRAKPRMVFVKQVFTATTGSVVYPHHFFVLGSMRQGDIMVRQYRMIKDVSALDTKAAGRKYFPIPAPHGTGWSRRESRGNGAEDEVSTVFKIVKEAGKLTTAIILRKSPLEFLGQDIVILLGSITNLEIGFDICETKGAASLADFQDEFTPYPIGTIMELSSWKFTITTREQVDSGKKIYFVDLFVTRLGKAEAGEIVETPKGVDISKAKGPSIKKARPL